MKRWIFLPLAMLASPLAAAESAPAVGILPDPCAVLPPMPAVIADYLARAR